MKEGLARTDIVTWGLTWSVGWLKMALWLFMLEVLRAFSKSETCDEA